MNSKAYTMDCVNCKNKKVTETVNSLKAEKFMAVK